MIFGEPESNPQGRGPQAGQQQVRVDMSTMENIYANFFIVGSSAEEMNLAFGVTPPVFDARNPTIKLSHRIVMLPPKAKQLMVTLQQTLKQYEDRFGPIELPPPPQNPGGQTAG